MKIIITSLFLGLMIHNSYAKQKSPSTEMQRVLHSWINLLPLAASERKFTDPTFEKKISKNLEKLNSSLQVLKHNDHLNNDTFQPSFSILKEQIDEAYISFKNGSKNLARLKLNEVSNLCLSCHNQLPHTQLKKHIINHKLIENTFSQDPFLKANIQFIIRDYKDAMESYKIVITEQLSEKYKSTNRKESSKIDNSYFSPKLSQSLFNTLLISTKVLNDPKLSKQIVSNYLIKYSFPKYLELEIKGWIKQLEFWIVENDSFSIKNIDRKKINALLARMDEKYAQTSPLSGEFDIDLMMISGILSRYYHSKQQAKDTGRILYWLGLSEYRLNKKIFYSLGDKYLEKCIRDNPKSEVAKKCYRTLHEEIVFRNTGSAGTNIPKSAKAKLEELKGKL